MSQQKIEEIKEILQAYYMPIYFVDQCVDDILEWHESTMSAHIRQEDTGANASREAKGL